MVPGIGVDVISKRLCIPGPACVFNTDSTECIVGSMLSEASFCFLCCLVPLPLGWCLCRWAGDFAVELVRLPLGWCVCRWAGAFVGLVRLPLGRCVCRWAGAFAVGHL